MPEELTPNQERGYKAAISNPNVSDEAKEHVKEILQDNELGGKDPANVAAGLKGAINNPNTTDEGRKAAQEKLDNM